LGIKSINNVVDLTNYYMMLTGQPLHAFDYDKLAMRSKKPTLGPRMAREGEVITLLGGKEVKLTEHDIVIATDSQAVAIAGVMGGADTEVDETTKTIVIECATFDMYSIRRTSMRHGLFTDAVTRFTKGQRPLQNDRVLGKIVDDLVKDGAIVASEGFDMRTATVVSMPAVTVTAAFINER
jgi:phenylalanyl-tRNA synthetase beta chain